MYDDGYSFRETATVVQRFISDNSVIFALNYTKLTQLFVDFDRIKTVDHFEMTIQALPKDLDFTASTVKDDLHKAIICINMNFSIFKNLK